MFTLVLEQIKYIFRNAVTLNYHASKCSYNAAYMEIKLMKII